MKKLLPVLCGIALGAAAGCRDAHDSHGHSHSGAHAHDHDNDHAPPHGGTPVLVAEDKFHLELVLAPSESRMQAYVLDGHLESYVHVPETSFRLAAKLDGNSEELEFKRTAEPASGQVPEKSSLFEARAEWLKSAKGFEAVIPTITLNGTTFTNVSFSFPKGSKHVH